MKILRSLFLVTVGVLLAACGGGTQVTTELKNITSISEGASRDLLFRASGDVTSNLTIDSLKIPIRDVSLGTGEALSGGDGNANVVYQCSGSSASECMVELVGSELENLFSSSTGSSVFSIDAGTYTSVMVATCFEESTYEAEIKASVSLGGTTYYTKTGEARMTTVQADYSPVAISFSGCRNYSILDAPITIGEAAATVSLFIDLRNIAAASNNDGKSPTSSCTVSETSGSETEPFICLSYPNVAGSINSTPTIERYTITTSGSDAARLIGLYFDPDSGAPVGGYDRDYYTDTFFGDSNVFGSFKRAFLENDQLVVTDYRNGSTDTISGNGDATLTNFLRKNVSESQSIAVVDGDGNSTGTTVTVTRVD